MYYNPRDEKEISNRLLALVNNCLEEGQYETAIANLDKLRAPAQRPSASHILQLIVIALYPPPEPTSRRKQLMASPRKIQERHKAALIPSPDATRAAIILLDAFSRTNHPLTLTAGLPRYPGDDPLFKEQSGLGELEDTHTFTAPIALEIATKPDFWQCLHAGFIKRPDGRRQDSPEPAKAVLVASTAWPVLRWFIDICKLDQEVSEGASEGSYSRVLLHQVPVPRAGVGLRWDTANTVAVLLACFQAIPGVARVEKERRHAAGVTFLDLLVNLLKAQVVSIVHFMKDVCGGLESLSPADANGMFAAIHRRHGDFKVSLCRSYITRLSEGEQKETVTKRPRPRARPAGGAGAGAPAPQPTQATPSMPKPNPFPLPTIQELVTLLDASPQNEADLSDPERMVVVKYHLLYAYGTVRQDSPEPEWTRFLQTQQFQELVTRVFPAGPLDGVADYRTLFQQLREHWMKS